MNDSDYTLLYAQGTRVHEAVVLKHAGFTPEEQQLFRLIRHHGNPDSAFIEDAMHIDPRTRRRIERGMRLKVAWLLMESLREYGENH